ncbi:hypothetical protein [Acinetobacter soli]|uniref:hypothetical protein n=1 Tax=Acinetobacter soli TaxID=487316 RepID=UPI0012307965|nr:hypothetical protein [Acinetobacter soli]WOQ37636.1 hypothetical protein R3L12_03445 [Acinetobacter soli]
MMKRHSLALLLLSLSLTACDRSPEQPEPKTSADHVSSAVHSASAPMRSSEAVQAQKAPKAINYQAQFEQSDKQISHFMDLLDNPNTSQTQRVQILCVDWPNVYKSEYIPALVHLKPNQFNETKLLAELRTATDYYKEGSGIVCK